MKKIQLMAFMLLLWTNVTPLYADSNAAADQTFPPVKWISKNSRDQVNVHNGSGLPLIVVVQVNDSDFNPAGVNIKNCGTTTYIEPGSVAVCATKDPSNPVTISSDSGNNPASGTYQIKLQSLY